MCVVIARQPARDVANPSRTLAEGTPYTYNAAQQRIRDELADGSSWNWEYDRLGQVIGGRKSWPDGNPVAGQQFEYGFDDIGNRVSQKRGGDANGANLRSTTYGVNPLNQITSRTVVGSRYLDLIGLAEPGTTVTAGGVIASRRGEFWRSEMNLGNGNPLWQSVNITTSDGGSLANALYRVPPSSEVPTYDADGNLTSDGLWTYTWDAENRLISMQSQALVPTAGRRKLDFEYDPLGRRIGRTVSTGAGGSWLPTSTTRWLYEGWNPVAELNSAGTLVREYVWGTDLSGNWQGAGGVGGLLWVLEAPTGANAVHYVAYDGNGNVMGLVNAADGTWSARYEYGPFGEVIRATGPMASANPFRWSTKIQDEDSGLNYYGYRYYSAGMGRWLGRDPVAELGGVNLIAFLGNSPIDLVDYLGNVRFGDDNWPPTRFSPRPDRPATPPHTFTGSVDMFLEYWFGWDRGGGLSEEMLAGVLASDVVQEFAESAVRDGRSEWKCGRSRRYVKHLELEAFNPANDPGISWYEKVDWMLTGNWQLRMSASCRSTCRPCDEDCRCFCWTKCNFEVDVHKFYTFVYVGGNAWNRFTDWMHVWPLAESYYI